MLACDHNSKELMLASLVSLRFPEKAGFSFFREKQVSAFIHYFLHQIRQENVSVLFIISLITKQKKVKFSFYLSF